MDGEQPHGDLFGNLESVLQRGGRGRKQALPVLLGRELIEREISTDDGKGCRVFGQAFRLKPFLRKPAAREIAFRSIDLSEPTFVLPGAGPDQDTSIGERNELLAQ